MANIPSPVDATKTAAWQALQENYEKLWGTGFTLSGPKS